MLNMKTKVILHYPKNFESRRYRYYNYIFDNLYTKLQENFDTMCTGYYRYANMKQYNAHLSFTKTDTFEHIPELLLHECEVVIENYTTKEFKILSVADDLTHCILNQQSNPLLTQVLVAQYNKDKINHHLTSADYYTKYNPWVYMPQNNLDFDFYYQARKTQPVNNFIDKFYFRGTSLEIRSIVNYFDKDLFYGGASLHNFHDYAAELINHKVGFSIAGRGEFCYRDIEYMAMGIPFIRYEYSNKMNPNLIPNYHYISVPRGEDIGNERNLKEEHARAIEQRFKEVKDDNEFLSFISRNAREYYETYITLDNCTNHTYNLLNLDSWK